MRTLVRNRVETNAACTRLSAEVFVGKQLAAVSTADQLCGNANQGHDVAMGTNVLE